MANTPFEQLLERLQAQLGPTLPNGLVTGLQNFFEQYALLSKDRVEAQMATLTALEEEVTRLQQRVTELESAQAAAAEEDRSAEQAPAKKARKKRAKVRPKKADSDNDRS